MPVTDSPLRYPGGKTKIYPKVKHIIRSVLNTENCIYIEPYAGGAGLALKLLYEGDVGSVVLNDLDYHIYSFWNACLNDTELLCDMIKGCYINIDEWKKQKNIYEYSEKFTPLEVGFSTFFLNRCNVSGIISGGPIGGATQAGKYKIDARFNKENLIRKIKKIALHKDNIIFYNMDAMEFLDMIIPTYDKKRVFLNIDPPYVKKGPMLYKNSYTRKDHTYISEQVKKLQNYWIVTYDACDLIKELYKEYYIEDMTLSYSAGSSKTGDEYIIYSNLIKGESTND